MNDEIIGCLIGGAVGDASGAPLEFYRSEITDETVYGAMRMPGGGALKVGAGQLTDDSELAISLMSNLVLHTPEESFPADTVALSYIAWFQSRPFDIGNTCRNAMRLTLSGRDDEHPAQQMILLSKQKNMDSESNGSLMRCAAIGVWARHLSNDIIADYARQDASLSHPNEVCQDVNAVFCILIAYLIKNPRDFKGATMLLDEPNCGLKDELHETVKSWIESSKMKDISALNCALNMGHVKYAFILMLFFLRNDFDYETAIFQTLKKGGDTDTNAAIVGNLIGCLKGYGSIPEYMVLPVLAFDCSTHVETDNSPGYNRPERYRSVHITDFSSKFSAI
jgi:ADP-ribosyl-[dinitrogen reductase] hydrolase